MIHRHLKNGVAAIALLAIPAVAHAQSTAAPAPKPDDKSAVTGVQDIVVTATRTETSLQNTPLAVTALSGETLQQRGATSLLDVQNSTPSLTVSSRSTAGSGRGGFTIRGIGVDSVNSSSAVGLYVDEVYYPSAAGNLLGLFDVERIEVLRGPQGTLFGRNTIAGAVQYITKKPDQQLGGFVTGTYGNLDRLEIAGALNVPLGDTLAIRVSGRYSRQGGYVYDELNDIDRGREVTKQGRVAIRWEPTPTLTVDLKGEMLDLKGNGRALSLLAFNQSLNPPGTPNAGAALVFAAFGFGLNPADIFTIQPSTSRYRFQGFNAEDSQKFEYRTAQGKISWDLNDFLTLKSITAYSYSNEVSTLDLDNTIVAIAGGSRGKTTNKLFTQEVQLSGKILDDKLAFTLGGYYFNSVETVEQQLFYFGPSPLAIPPGNGDPKIKNVALAAYGQLTYNFTDRFSATAGLRYSNEKVTGSFLNSQVPGLGTPTILPAAFAPYDVTFSDLSPSFGLNFQADQDTLIYAKASKGFRAGGTAVNGNLINPAPPIPAVTTTPGYQPYGQEVAWTYEIGARLQFLDRRVRINPTIFYTKWSDIQFNSFIFTGTPPTPNVITRNAGDARIWGVELEWQAVVSDRFSLNGSFSYLNSKYTRIEPGIDVTLNSELQHAPDLKFSVGARYEVPMPNGDKLTLNTDYAWTADQRSAVSDGDFITQPEYGLLNARITYAIDDGRYSLAVYGTNLTRQYYYIGGVNGSGTFGSTEADIGRPREVGVTLTARF